MEIIKVVVLFEGWLKLLRAEVKGTMGKISHRLIEDHGSAVAILPYDPTRRTVLLISQFRPPVEHGVPGSRNVLEPIAGRIDDGDPDASARREAMEEAGVELAKLELVATCWSMPAVSTERIYLYLAPYALENRVAPGGGLAEEDEEISIHELSFDELRNYVEGPTPVDLKLLALFTQLNRRIA